MKIRFSTLLILIFTVTGIAQNVTWNFATASPSSGAVANLTVSALSQGNNNGTTTLITTTSASSGYVGSTGTNNAGAAARVGAFSSVNSAYFEFTLTPAAGYTAALTDLTFGTRSTGTGPQAYSIRSSADGFASDLVGGTGTIANNSNWALKTNFGLSSVSGTGTAITYRIYGHAGSGTDSANTANWRIDDLNLTVVLTQGFLLDGIMNEAVWGSALSTSSGGPTPSFGASHVINSVYSFGDATNLYFGIGGNVQTGNRILLFIDSKSGGYNNGSFGRVGAPLGLLSWNGSSTFDSGFNADYCVVIGTNGSGTYYFDLFTLSATGSYASISASDFGVSGHNTDITRGFEFRIPKTTLGYTANQELQLFAAYIGDSGYLSNQFLSPAGSAQGSYTGGTVNFGAEPPNPITVPYISKQTGNWNDGTTWKLGTANPTNVNVSVLSGHNVTVNASAAPNSLSNAGTLTVSGTNTITFGSGSTFAQSGTFIPATGKLIFSGSGTITGTVGAYNMDISGGVTLSNTVTINNALTIKSGGFINGANAPIYGSSSTLFYESNYNVGNEWTGNSTTAGSGVPKNVTIQNSATVTMPTTSRGLAGDLTISSGGLALSSTSGSDLYVAGNWTRANAATFTPNGRAVIFNSPTNVDQTVNVTGGTAESFAYLTVAGAGTLRPVVGLNVTASSGLSLSSSNATSTINLNAQTLTLSGGGNLNLNTGTRLITSTTTGGIFRITSNPITITNGGSLSFAATNTTVDLQNGLDCGTASMATINGRLQINANGYCFGNSPKYGNASTLQYNSGTNPYNRSLEWTAAPGTIGTTPGYPKNVQISNNTKLNYVNASNLGEKGVDGNLTIDAGAALYMNYGSATCGGTLTIAGTLNNAGDLVLGQSAGDDLKVTGDINFTGSYTFDANKRAVILKGATTQTISASTKPTFHYLNLDGGNSMVADITCDLDITAPDTGNVISFSNASQVVKLNAGRTLVLGTTGVNNSFSATTGSFNGSTTSNLTLRGNGSIGTLKFVTSLNLGTLTVDRQNSVNAFTLGTALTVNTSLVMSKGLADLSTQTLTLGGSATASGNSNSFVIADVDGNTGRLRKNITGFGTFTFPIGDAAASANGSEYSPATVQFTAGGFGSSYLAVAVKDDIHPSIDAAFPDRISRYWTTTVSGTFSAPTYIFTGVYTDNDVDVTATEANFKSGRWNGTEWTEGASVNAAANTMSVTGLTTISGTNEFSAGFPLGLGEINVRGNATTIASGNTAISVTDHTDFGKLCADKERTYTIQNLAGRGPLLISGVTITGANAGDFTVSGITTSPALSIAVNGSTTFKVTFNPSADGLRNAVVNIANNDSNENPYTFAIQGNGDEEINVKADGDEAGGSASANIANNDMDASQAQDYLNNTRFAETDIGVDSVIKIYKIQNLGTRDLTLSGSPRVSISGSHPSDFIVTQIVPLSPAAIGSCSEVGFRIKFKPTAPGDRNAIVTISNSDSDEGTYTFALQGKGREAEIDVKGNNVSIVSGTTTISETNHTKFPNTHITAATSTRTYTIYNTGGGVLNVFTPTLSGANAADFSITVNPSSTVAATSGSTTFTITFDPTSTGIKTATVSIVNSDVDENPYTFNIEGKAINYIECASNTVMDIGVQDFEDVPATPTWAYSISGTAVRQAGTAYAISGDSGATPKYIGGKSIQFSDVDSNNSTVTSSTIEFSDVNTLNFTDIELSLRVGSYSTTTGNGAESDDYVLVSVKQDNGSWSDEIRVRGNSNSKWAFSSGLGNATAVYDNNGIVEAGKIYGPATATPEFRTTDGYSYVTLSGLPSVSSLKIRITLSNTVANEIWAIDNVILKGKTQAVKTWNGTNWLDAANAISTPPTSSQKAIIDGDYDSEINGGSIWACEVEVTSNGNIIVDGNSILDVQSSIISNGTITLENNASLIQYDDFATDSGSITMRRYTQPMYRYDYNYWSSPLTASSMFTLSSLSPNTLADKYYYWNGATQGWALSYNGTEVMVPGKGYIIRAPQTFSTDPSETQPYEDGEFSGTPNNGEITYEVYGTSDPAVDKWNLLGNPYPCAISIEKFFDLLSGNRSVLDGTLHFWTHNTPVQSNNYTSSDYASYNFTGPISSQSSSNGLNMNLPNGYVAAGQAFFVKGISNAPGHVTFNNAMRGGLNNQYFRSGPTSTTSEGREANRIWLNINGEQSGFNQTLVGYVAGATNDIDWGYDGDSFSGNSVTIYSIANTKKLGIQGRALPFNDQDTVQLGYASTNNGLATISIDHYDGIFSSQNIYLEDLSLNIIHDLKAAPYIFTTLTGTFNDRFVLRYTNTALGLDPVNPDNGLIVYKEKKQLHFLSHAESIADITVFDLAGRLIFQKNDINNKSFTANEITRNQQVLIVKVKLANGKVIARKVIY